MTIRVPETLTRLLGRSLSLLNAFATPPSGGRPYNRIPLIRADGVEVVLVRWRGGVPTAPHDHGGAEGVVFFLRGSFMERRYEFTDDRLEGRGTELILPGGVSMIEAEDVHDVTALDDDGLSLHVYFDEGSMYRIFDPEERRTLTVRSYAGAWLPMRREHVVREEEWSTAERG